MPTSPISAATESAARSCRGAWELILMHSTGSFTTGIVPRLKAARSSSVRWGSYQASLATCLS